MYLDKAECRSLQFFFIFIVKNEQVVGEVATFLAQDYRKRFQAALALLTEMYVADVAAISAANMSSNSAPPKNSTDARPHGGKTPEGGVAQTENKARSTRQAKGFELYDKALVSLLTKLSGSLEPSWRQKLFTQTLLECPRVPPQALELVCSLCDMASKPCDIQTGEMTPTSFSLLLLPPSSSLLLVDAVDHWSFGVLLLQLFKSWSSEVQLWHSCVGIVCPRKAILPEVTSEDNHIAVRLSWTASSLYL